MISTEKVFDMLPSVVEIYDILNIDEYRKKMAKENKGKKLDQMTMGIDLIKFILKNSGKVKNEVFEVVAVFEEKPVEQIKAQDFMITIKTLKAIFTDKEALDFFKDAMR